MFHEQVNWQIKAFFSMEGLGIGILLEHGFAHHFMGSLFAHHTCLPVCQRSEDGKVTASNRDNNFLVVGWGTSGGKREVAEAAAAAAAATNNGAQSDAAGGGPGSAVEYVEHA